jgi:hypothetical protein
MRKAGRIERRTLWVALVVMLAVVGAGLAGSARGAGDAKGTFGILRPTAAYGIEKKYLESLGYTTQLLSTADWQSANFSSYAGLVIGDYCDRAGGALGTAAALQAATANSAVWGSAVTGNVALLGSAPSTEYQGSAGGYNQTGPVALIKAALNFVAAGSGTGLYLSMGCHMDDLSADALLSGLGSFTTTALRPPPCVGQVDVVGGDALYPAALTSGDFQGWLPTVCPANHVFTSYPAGYRAYANLTGVPGGPAPFVVLHGIGQRPTPGVVVDPETTIDATPPAFTSSAYAQFSFSSLTPETTFTCQLDGGSPSNCGSPWDYDGLAEGSHTFSVYATDLLTDAFDATPAEYTWTVDWTAPDTTITRKPGNAQNPATATFEFTSEPEATFTCKLDADAEAPCLSGQTYTGLGDGQHTFSVSATDQAGNVDPSPATVTWTVDATPPETTLVDTPAALVNTGAATFAFTASEQGATFTCKLDTGPAAACGSPASLSGLADGSHTFAVFATDSAGNADPSPASYTWTVDTSAPDTSITAKPSSPSSSSSASFGFASEAGATFRCRLDGGAFASCVSPRTYSGLADGSHTFQVYATDAAGNADPTPASFTWTISTAPPAAGSCEVSARADARKVELDAEATLTRSKASGDVEYQAGKVSFHGKVTSVACNADGSGAVLKGTGFTLTLTVGSGTTADSYTLTAPGLNASGEAKVKIKLGKVGKDD